MDGTAKDIFIIMISQRVECGGGADKKLDFQGSERSWRSMYSRDKN